MGGNDRPDLVLVMTDQQRFDQVGFAPGSPVRTPHLDRLAGSGVIFDNAYSASTTCVPARTSLMTGLLDHRTPYSAPRSLEVGSWTVPHALRAAGYQTALIGKMHFNPIRAPHGFEHLRLCEHLNAYTQDPRDHAELDHYHDWLHARGLDDWRFETADAMGSVYRYDVATHPTTWVRDETLAFLEQRDRDRPLFLVVSFPHPHPPVNPPEPWASMYEPGAVVIDPEGASANQYLPKQFREATAQADHPGRRIDPDNLDASRRVLARTYGLITQIDDAVGHITAQLDLGRALVFFTSDHGDYAGHRGLVRKIPWIPFDDLAKVPCFATGGLVAGGRRDPSPMQSFDMAATWLACAGVDVDLGQLDGIDLGPVLADPDGVLPADRVVFSAISMEWPMARRGPHKYLRSPGWVQEVLFDVERDPGETYNVLSLDTDREITAALAAAVDEQLAAGPPRLPTFHGVGEASGSGP